MTRGRRILESLEDDIRDHIERETRDNLDRGMAPEEARRQALLKFGNVALVKEDTRAIWRWQRVEQLAQDSGYAIRILRRRPVYALLSVLTLALGIGGTAAVFGVAQGVLLSPLPYAHERELGVFWMKTDWTHEEYLHIRGRTPGFRQVALYRQGDAMLRVGGGSARLVPGVTASSELLDVLGAAPLLGRGFREGDDVPGAEGVALLSFGLWQELGGDPAIIGTYVTLDGRPRTVIGVMPRGFWFPDPSVRIWTPVPLRADSRSWNSTIIGRVAPDQDVRAMEAPLSQLTAMLDERFDYPARRDKTKDRRITPVRDDLLGPMQPALLATLAATALILLIGCANVAALVLGQVDARSAEFAVRSALGANRQRLAQQLIVEVLIVAVVAGTLGAALAWVGFTVVTDALPLGAWASTAPDWRVFASAMAIAVIAASLVILVPIVSLYRGDLRRVLSAARMGGIEGRGGRLESGLVVAQVALAVMIASGAALLARSVANMYAVQPGVRVDGVAVVDVVFDGTLDRASREKTLAELERALRELPGVTSVGAGQTLPLRGGGYRAGLRIDERPEIQNAATEFRIVTPGYLESLGFALRRGRAISGDDRPEAERVVVINEAFAHKYFPGVDPIGRSIGVDDQGRSRIVGVVADAAEKRLTDAAEPVRYVALAQMPWIDDAQSIVLRTAPGVAETSLLEPVRRTVARVAPAVAVQQTTTMRRVLDTSVGPARQVVSLLSLLAGLALILGAVGVYGVMTHFATRRRRDWAIRIAIGLPGSRVIAHILGHGAMLVSAGIVAGIVGAAMLTRLLSSFLFDVSALDPIAFAAAGAALFGVGVAAAFVPALRAGMADPLEALREQ
jgi:putative ABC transport system permease protein